MFDTIIIFDLETTGTNVATDRIVQLSAQKLNLNFEPIEERRDLLINPMMPIPEEATKVHNITNEMVKDAPTFRHYAKALHGYFAGSIIGGFHSNEFDVPLLSEEFRRTDLAIKWPTNEPLIDVRRIFTAMVPKTLAGAVLYYCAEKFEDGHDAGRDVNKTVQVLQAQMQAYPDLRAMGIRDLELFCNDGKRRADLCGKLAFNEAGQIVYNFGKDKGKTVKENPGFGYWMLDQDFPTDTKELVRSLIPAKTRR